MNYGNNKERYVAAVSVKCSKCGHLNHIQKETPYLYDMVNTHYCDICKSKEVDIERIY